MSPVTSRYRLTNPHGWVLVYTPHLDGRTVLLERYYRGETVRFLTLSLTEARLHYASQLRAGFVAMEKF